MVGVKTSILLIFSFSGDIPSCSRWACSSCSCSSEATPLIESGMERRRLWWQAIEKYVQTIWKVSWYTNNHYFICTVVYLDWQLLFQNCCGHGNFVKEEREGENVRGGIRIGWAIVIFHFKSRFRFFTFCLVNFFLFLQERMHGVLNWRMEGKENDSKLVGWLNQRRKKKRRRLWKKKEQLMEDEEEVRTLSLLKVSSTFSSDRSNVIHIKVNRQAPIWMDYHSRNYKQCASLISLLQPRKWREPWIIHHGKKGFRIINYM